jgi:hypothetical protein
MNRFLRSFFICLMLLSAVFVLAQTQQQMHKVAKHETVYGIAHQYGLTEQELISANPEMSLPDFKLKKGMFLFIPLSKVENTVATDNIKGRAIRIGVLLPLHEANGDGKRMTDYYRGLLMACDSLKNEGISLDINTWNVTDKDDIRQFLLNDALHTCDVIFGPLYSSQMHDLSNFVKVNNIKLFVPFSISASEVYTNNNIFQVYRPDTNSNFDIVAHFIQKFSGFNPIFIDCNDTASTKGSFTSELRRQLDSSKTDYAITNLNSTEGMFAKAFNRNKPNVVILNSGSFASLHAAVSKLKTFSTNNPGVVFSVFGYEDWLMYVYAHKEDFFRMDTYIPSAYYCDMSQSRVIDFIHKYKKLFHKDMINTSQRFAMTGFDHAYFFLKGLSVYGKAFTGAKSTVRYIPLQSPLTFERVGGGGFMNHSQMLIHYSYNHNIEIINY